jgi:hypothetical protein
MGTQKNFNEVIDLLAKLITNMVLIRNRHLLYLNKESALNHCWWRVTLL